MLLTIIHKKSKSGTFYANITNVSGVEEGREVPELVNQSFVLLNAEKGEDQEVVQQLKDSNMKWIVPLINFKGEQVEEF